jgi:hypothetical protein
MKIINIDGFEIDVSLMSKKIEIKGNAVTFTLDFPLYTETKKFKTEKEVKEFLNLIKKSGDKVKYT